MIVTVTGEEEESPEATSRGLVQVPTETLMTVTVTRAVHRRHEAPHSPTGAEVAEAVAMMTMAAAPETDTAVATVTPAAGAAAVVTRTLLAAASAWAGQSEDLHPLSREATLLGSTEAPVAEARVEEVGVEVAGPKEDSHEADTEKGLVNMIRLNSDKKPTKKRGLRSPFQTKKERKKKRSKASKVSKGRISFKTIFIFYFFQRQHSMDSELEI